MKRSYTFIHVIIALCCLAFAGCDIVNPAEPVPSFIQLKDPVVVTQSGSDSISEKITNTWIYLNGDALGVYNRRGLIPVIGEGNNTIICLAGVMENGVSSFRVPYPFYGSDTTLVTLSPNNNIQINPTYRYLSSTQFSFDDNFNQQGSLFGPRTGNTASLEWETGSNVFQGGGSGRVMLTDSASVFEYETIESYPLTSSNGSIYIEIDYKNDIRLQVGLYQGSSGATYYGWNITPKDEWNKLYLNLLSPVRNSGGGNYKILLRAEKALDGDTAFIYLDNIRLLHF